MLNDDMYERSPEEFDMLMKYLLTAKQNLYTDMYEGVPFETNLYKVYTSFVHKFVHPSIAQQKLAEYIINIRMVYNVDLYQNAVSGIEFESTNKMDNGNQNQFTVDEFIDKLKTDQTDDVLISTHQSASELVVLNPNQDKYDNETKYSSQQEDVIGIGDINHERSARLATIKKTIVERGIKKWTDRIKKQGFDKIARQIGKDSIKNRSDINRMVSFLENNDISIEMPTVRGSIQPSIISKLSEDIKKKVAGKKMVQNPSTFVPIYDVEDQYGNKMIVTQIEINDHPEYK